MLKKVRLTAESEVFSYWPKPFLSLLLYFIVVAGNREQQAAVRRRAGKGHKVEEDGGAVSGDVSDLNDKTAHISVTSVAEVSSDLNPQDPLQKVVRFSSDLSLLLTGGTDGHIRVWEVNTVHCRVLKPSMFWVFSPFPANSGCFSCVTTG